MTKFHPVYKELKHENEIAIMKRYSYTERCFTVLCIDKIIYIIHIKYN